MLNVAEMLEKFRMIKSQLKQKGWRGYIVVNPYKDSWINGDQNVSIWELICDEDKLVVFVDAEKTDWSTVSKKHLELFVERIQDLRLDNMEVGALTSRHINNHDTIYYGVVNINNFDRFVGALGERYAHTHHVV
ncbi:hypothetical protein L1765_10155 [Microaerobacter geothermalis]|uniref:hypothetical protein n=1 Tax=Microaerobacter geothermalis TaxID=674972 RepID=UPI001F29C45E|nr:hypothetical protein [Microaerobacter geothermalis]MCF6094325.1 hypothetical protein [Microaerobacter geothermalis]